MEEISQKNKESDKTTEDKENTNEQKETAEISK
jgi:hypothetical protein